MLRGIQCSHRSTRCQPDAWEWPLQQYPVHGRYRADIIASDISENERFRRCLGDIVNQLETMVTNQDWIDNEYEKLIELIHDELGSQFGFHTRAKPACFFLDVGGFKMIFWAWISLMLVLRSHSNDRKSSWDKGNICYPKTNIGCPPSPANRTSTGFVKTHSIPNLNIFKWDSIILGSLPQSQGHLDFRPDCCSLFNLSWLHIRLTPSALPVTQGRKLTSPSNPI